MAHFAQLDENNCVLQVIAVSNSECLDQDGNESEAVGVAFCKSLLGGEWVQTSYSAKIRRKYAAIGYTYDPNIDAFIPPKPYNSWVLDLDLCDWVSPVPVPEDFNVITKPYTWNEENQSWDFVEQSS